MDIDSIAPGADFNSVLIERLSHCKVALVLIGPMWETASDDEGRTRLSLPDDFVRCEVEKVLVRFISVVPILVDRHSLPRVEDLPEPLQPIIFRNALPLRHESFDGDSRAIANHIASALGRPLDRELDLIRLLFSFKGTSSRSRFWIGLGVLTIIQIGAEIGLLWAMGVPVIDGLFDPQALSTRQKAGMEIALAWVWWPWLALAWKRIRDLGHGLDLFLPLAVVCIAQICSNIIGLNSLAETLSTIFVVMLLLIGGLVGTRFIDKSLM